MAVVPLLVLSAALLGGPQQQLRGVRQQLTEVQQLTALQQLTGVQQQLTGVLQQLTGVLQQLTGVQQQLTGVQQQLTALQQLTGVQQQLTGVQQQLTALQRQLSAVQQQQTALQNLMLPVPETPSATAEECPVSWVGIDNSCYLLSPDKASWLEAKQACSAFDPRANLVSIHPDNKDHLLRLLREARDGRESVWIGLFRLHHNGGSWGWADGTPLDHTGWSLGEPNNHGEREHCGALWQGQGDEWFDHQCSEHFGFLCQIYLT